MWRLEFLDAYAEEGLHFWGITPQNEPSHGRVFDTAFNNIGWTADQQLEWVVGNLAPTLEENGYSDLELMILDDMRSFLAEWVDTFFGNETANKFTSGVGIHWYLDSLSNTSLLDAAHEAFPDKFLLYTESCITNNNPQSQPPIFLGSWSRGESYVTSIIEVTNHWVTGWVDWNLALDPDGGPNWAKNPVDSSIIVNATADEFYKQPMFYALAHFSKFVPPGSVRISLETENNSNFIENVAFVTEDGIKVIILQNKINGTSTKEQLELEKQKEKANEMEQKVRVDEIVNIVKGISGCSEWDVDDVEEWFLCDSNDQGFQIMTDDEILESVVDEQQGDGEGEDW
uniref:Glucosylceramidase n=1 Tax=Timema shepardi TaxID=629360 RepID=A0A7R9AUL1_TIMSH|nr:unnamed protein product [Timema shepardi]